MIFKDNSILVDSKDFSRLGTDESLKGFEYIPLRSISSYLSHNEMENVLYEFQMFNWDRRTKYCGVCGALNIRENIENCKICPKCGEKNYPAQYPAIIVSIIKGDEILLAHNASFSNNMYSIIAGFVDIGEGLEGAVVREVKEEVGLEIENIRYFGSQNWGFSSSLMLGFTADYKSGEIEVDGVEIEKAGWFSSDVSALPELPPGRSMGRQLIDKFLREH